MVISLSGLAGSGKDTAGKIIQWLRYSQLNPDQNNIDFDSWMDCPTPTMDVINSGWEIKKWATALRKVAAILLGMDEKMVFSEEFKQMVLPEQWWYYDDGCHTEPYLTGNHKMMDGYNTLLVKTTGRQFLQKLGTDAIRNELHKETWVNALMSQYRQVDLYPYPNWIITDTRFPNELAAVKVAGGVTIEIRRDTAGPYTQVA